MSGNWAVTYWDGTTTRILVLYSDIWNLASTIGNSQARDYMYQIIKIERVPVPS